MWSEAVVCQTHGATTYDMSYVMWSRIRVSRQPECNPHYINVSNSLLIFSKMYKALTGQVALHERLDSSKTRSRRSLAVSPGRSRVLAALSLQYKVQPFNLRFRGWLSESASRSWSDRRRVALPDESGASSRFASNNRPCRVAVHGSWLTASGNEAHGIWSWIAAPAGAASAS